jgi:hypothetical protein
MKGIIQELKWLWRMQFGLPCLGCFWLKFDKPKVARVAVDPPAQKALKRG